MTGATGVSPLPVPDPDSAEYWQRLAGGELAVQRCTACDHRQHYWRAMCVRCWSPDVEALPVSEPATVYSFTTVHQVGDPALRAQVPYVIALVDLAEGPRMLTRITGDTAPQIGDQVVFEPHEITPGVTLPYFRPVTR